MPIDASDFATHGKIIATSDGSVIFAPRGTTYEMSLKTEGGKLDGPTNTPVEAVIRVTARKIWTVPSGGNFVSPIMGPPKIIQGRVREVDDQSIVVHAGATFVVALPGADNAIDLPHGPITVGNMVNVTAFAGATIEIVERLATSSSPGVPHTGTGPGAAHVP
jgi:hypothetical protein